MPRRPRRALGQHFLVDAGFRARIVEAVGIQPGETVLEIGPGRGALTEGLVREVETAEGRLVLVELDSDLAAELASTYRDHPRVEVVRGDILDHPPAALTSEPEALRVVGNIPYNLTSPILFHLLKVPRPREILIMVQAEVADRILSDPGTRDYGALTVGIRSVSEVERVLRVPAGAFWPRPNVESAVIRIRPLHPSPLTLEEESRLRDLTRAVFQWRRKQLGKILRDHPELQLPPVRVEHALAAAGVVSTARPEEVSPAGFLAMARRLAER